MGFFSTYTENVSINYRSTTLSRASFFNFVIFMLAVICPYLIAYGTQGLWRKIDHVREQPFIQFKHQALLVLDVEKNTTRETMVWSTFKGLNEMLGTKVTPFIISREGDHNMDGVFEYLDLQLTIPLVESTKVYGVHIFLLFDYKLLKHATLQMESLAYTNYNSGRYGNKFNLFADLDLSFKVPLWRRVRDERFNKAVIPRESTRLQDYHIAKILQDYSSRNLTTVLKNKYEFMEEDGLMRTNEFLVNIHINYVEATYECWAGLWNTIKWAWIQYVAIFIIVFSLLKTFQKLVYQAKIFESRTEVPWEKRNMSKIIISHHHHT